MMNDTSEHNISDFDMLNNKGLVELKPTDNIKHKCRKCGECCRNKEAAAVLLTGVDVYRMAKYLDIVPKELFESDILDWFVDEETLIPIPYIKTRDDGSCVFFNSNNNKCMIHDDKPISCTLYPIGRYIAENNNFRYFKPQEICGGAADAQELPLKDWLDQYRVNQLDSMVLSWNRVYSEVTTTMIANRVDHIINAKNMSNYLLAILYTNYDVTGDYDKQVEENLQHFRFTCESLLHIV